MQTETPIAHWGGYMMADGRLFIGQNGNQDFANEQIDDVVVYRRGLDDQQIRTLMNHGPTSLSSHSDDLLAHYCFDAGDATDCSASGQHGINHGAEFVAEQEPILSVSETATMNTSIGTVQAYDPERQNLVFSLKADITPSPVTIHETTGVISVSDTGALQKKRGKRPSPSKLPWWILKGYPIASDFPFRC